jgi:hypothetical protein
MSKYTQQRIQQFLDANLEDQVTLTIFTKSGLESDLDGFLFCADGIYSISKHPASVGFTFLASDILDVRGECLVLDV